MKLKHELISAVRSTFYCCACYAIVGLLCNYGLSVQQEDTKTKDFIKRLLFFYDMSSVNTDFSLPNDLKFDQFSFTQAQFDFYYPSLDDRCVSVAYEVYYTAAKQKDPSITPENFKQVLDLEHLKLIQTKTKEYLRPNVTYDELRKYQRLKSLNLTQLDKNRQVH